MANEFKHTCLPNKCVPLRPEEFVFGMADEAHCFFNGTIQVSVSGHEVNMYGDGRVTIIDMVTGDIVYSGANRVSDEMSIDTDKLYSIMRAATIFAAQKFSAYKPLLEPCNAVIKRMNEVLLVSQVVGAKAPNTMNLVSKLCTKKTNPIQNVADILSILSSNDSGCPREDYINNFIPTLRTAIVINRANIKAVRKVLIIGNYIVRDIHFSILSSLGANALPSSEDRTIHLPNGETVEIMPGLAELDDQLACIEYIDQFADCVKRITTDTGILSIMEIYRRILIETGLTDAVRQYRAIRSRYRRKK